MALWKVKDEENLATPSTSTVHKCLTIPDYSIVNPVRVQTCGKAGKVRAMTYNENTMVQFAFIQ